MKKFLFLAIFCLICQICWATDYTQDANCEGAWRFTEGTGTTVADDSVNTNTGNFKGTGEPAWNTTDVNFGDTGSAPNSVQFDNSNDYINCGTDASLDDLSVMSFTIWVNLGSAGVNDSSRLFSKRNTSNTGEFRALVYNGGSGGNMQFAKDYDGATDIYRNSSNNWITWNTWTHLAYTWDGTATATGMKLYKNGVEESSYGTTQNGAGSPVTDADGNFYLGNRADGIRPVNGYITDTGIFSDVLSSTEINAIYDYGLSGQVAPPAARRVIMIS